MLLKHYLEQGVSKAELSRRFGVNRRTIHNWVKTGQLDRDLSAGPVRDAGGAPGPGGLRDVHAPLGPSPCPGDRARLYSSRHVPCRPAASVSALGLIRESRNDASRSGLRSPATIARRMRSPVFPIMAEIRASTSGTFLRFKCPTTNHNRLHRPNNVQDRLLRWRGGWYRMARGLLSISTQA